MKTITIEKKGKHNSQAYYDMVFLVSAIDLNERREQLHYVMVKDGCTWATNGHRLHVVNGITFDDGLYTFDKTAKRVMLIPAEDQSINYPNVDQVFPYEDLQDFNIKPGFFVERVLSTYAKEFGIGQSLDIRYLEPLNIETVWRMTISRRAEFSPVMFQNCTKTALIMPVRLA